MEKCSHLHKERRPCWHYEAKPSVWKSWAIDFQFLNSSRSSSCIRQVVKSLKRTFFVLWISPNVILKSDWESSLSILLGPPHLVVFSIFKHYTISPILGHPHTPSLVNKVTRKQSKTVLSDSTKNSTVLLTRRQR